LAVLLTMQTSGWPPPPEEEDFKTGLASARID